MSPAPEGARRVLVVDDEPMVRMLARRILEGAGFEVLEAADGREAMHLVLDHADSLALVVSDVVMPVMSGHDLADFLRRYHPTLPLLLMSGYTSEEVRRRYGLMAPWAPFLRKPFTMDELATAARAAIREHASPADAAADDAAEDVKEEG